MRFAQITFDELDSTNSEAARLAASGEAGPLWIVADNQTAGRGRRGRGRRGGRRGARGVAELDRDAEVVAAGGVVDSILPIAEQLRRFRGTLPPTDTLRYASPSPEALVSRWAAAIAKNDTTDLNAMIMDRNEFAWLYYLDSPMSKPPKAAPPSVAPVSFWPSAQPVSARLATAVPASRREKRLIGIAHTLRCGGSGLAGRLQMRRPRTANAASSASGYREKG